MLKGNKIYIIKKDGTKRQILGFIPGLRIKFKGKNSIVELHEPLAKFDRCQIKIGGNNSKVSIGASKHKIKKLKIGLETSYQTVHIGKDFFCFSCEITTASEDNRIITIGDDCMFARNITIRASDGHSIVNYNTKEILNKGKDVHIGNHVWLAGNILVLKGVTIGDNCAIGHGSIVTKNCEANSVYAGNPAKQVKKNVTWLRPSPGDLERERLKNEQ